MSKKIRLTESQKKYIVENAPVIVDYGKNFDETLRKLTAAISKMEEAAVRTVKSTLEVPFGKIISDVDEQYKRIDSLWEVADELDSKVNSFETDMDELVYDREEQGLEVDDARGKHQRVVQLQNKYKPIMKRLRFVHDILSDVHSNSMNWDSNELTDFDNQQRGIDIEALKRQ